MFCEPESAIGSPFGGGHLVRAGLNKGLIAPGDVMKAGLLSEVVLLGGEVIFVSLLLIVVAALMRA
jgi:hypothetical protein